MLGVWPVVTCQLHLIVIIPTPLRQERQSRSLGTQASSGFEFKWLGLEQFFWKVRALEVLNPLQLFGVEKLSRQNAYLE